MNSHIPEPLDLLPLGREGIRRAKPDAFMGPPEGSAKRTRSLPLYRLRINLQRGHLIVFIFRSLGVGAHGVNDYSVLNVRTECPWPSERALFDYLIDQSGVVKASGKKGSATLVIATFLFYFFTPF